MAQIILYQVQREIVSILGQMRPNGADVMSTANLDELTSILKDDDSHVEALVVGPDVPNPVRVAQQANSLRRNLGVVLLTQQEHLEDLRRALQFAPLVGYNTTCAAVEDLDSVTNAVARTARATTQQVKRQAALSAADSQIRQQSTPTMRRLYIEHVLHNAPVGLVATDETGNVLAWNTFATSLTGISERIALGRQVQDQLPEPWGARVWDFMTECLSEKTTHSKPLNIELRGRIVEVTCSILREQGDSRRLMLLMRDITEQWRAQREAEEARRLLLEANEALKAARDQAVEASRAKSTFLATMSHELRTPLNAIIGYSEMLQEQALDEKKDDMANDLARINYAGRHLLMLISEILDISKIEAGKMDLFVNRFDLCNVLNEVTSTVQPLMEKNRNSLIVQCGKSVGVILSDETKVRQVLYNLLSNAAKFTEDGEVRLTIERLDSGADDSISIEVADTGIGMTEEQMQVLFRDFSQVDHSTTRRYGGTGLGLAISKRFLDMMGGTISLSSEAGVGTRFRVTLPVVAPGHGEAHHLDVEQMGSGGLRPQLERGDGRKPPGKILVIDDDLALHQMLRHVLEKEQFQMESAFDGKTGIEMARELLPRAIILDVLMPEIDGWTVLTEIKADPKLADIPVIIVSIVDEKNLGFALGASDYLTKPFERSRLLSILRRYQCDLKQCNVLVVEDDEGIRELLNRLLTSSGCDVRMATNGVEGLSAVADLVPDVILLDLMMPEIDGFEFIERLRERPEWKAVPVIVITAKELDDHDRQRLMSGVSRVLHKGQYSKDDLLREIEAAMSEWER